MPDTAELITANAKRWACMKIHADASAVARRLVTGKARYVEVERITGVPWAVIAVIHEREASQNWNANIAQGDRWDQESTHVPAGRGPFPSWKTAACDALQKCAPYAAAWHDWSIGGALALLEKYNGLGYSRRGKPSPYIWAGSDQYVSGKYVADGVYDPDAVDHQLGCAVLLAAMIAIDTSITFGPSPPLADPRPLNAPLPKPVPRPWWAALFQFIAALFVRK